MLSAQHQMQSTLPLLTACCTKALISAHQVVPEHGSELPRRQAGMVREDLGHHHSQVHRGVTEHSISNARRQHLLVQA